MPIIIIPDKTVGGELTAAEFNTLKNAINETYDIANEVSHSLSEDHFKEEGTTVINGVPVPIIVLNLENIIDLNDFEIVGGKIKLKS